MFCVLNFTCKIDRTSAYESKLYTFKKIHCLFFPCLYTALHGLKKKKMFTWEGLYSQGKASVGRFVFPRKSQQQHSLPSTTDLYVGEHFHFYKILLWQLFLLLLNLWCIWMLSVSFEGQNTEPTTKDWEDGVNVTAQTSHSLLVLSPVLLSLKHTIKYLLLM